MFVIELRSKDPNEPCWYVSTMKGNFEFVTISSTVDNAKVFTSHIEAATWMRLNMPQWITEKYECVIENA